MQPDAAPSPQRPRLLIVCTGNLARSVMAQFLLAARLAQTSVSVESAGTEADEGLPMAVHAYEVLREVDVGANGFRSRRLSAQMVEQSDLVLTATREHRATVLHEVPRAMRRTFTLRELAGLVEHTGLDHTPPTSAAELATRAAVARGQLFVAGDDYDVADPYGYDLDVFRTCRDAITEAVDRIVPALRLVRE